MKEQSEEISDSKSQHFDEEDGNDKIEISSNSEESPKNNAFGFLQMNSLSNNLKERMNETQKAGFISDRNQKKFKFKYYYITIQKICQSEWNFLFIEIISIIFATINFLMRFTF